MSETIALLKPDKNNRRKHNERNIGMILNSLQQVGASRSIVIDEENNILAGNGTVEAAQIAGIERLRIIDADGEEIIAVRRSGLSDEQKRKLALYDNRTAELAEWDADQILADVEAGIDFNGMFRKDELDELIKGIDKVVFTPIVDPTFSTARVLEKDVVKEKARLDNRFKKGNKYLEVICPNCGNEFYIDVKDVH